MRLRHIAFLLVALPSAGAAGALAVGTLDGGAETGRLRLSVSPARQPAAPGQRVSFSVTVGGTRRRVELSAAGLPRGVRAAFKLSDGRRGRVIPAGQGGAILTLISSTAAEPGRERVTVRARSGGRVRERTVVLRLVSKPDGLAVLESRPSRRAVLVGETTSYRVRVRREESDPIRLGVSGLPEGTRARWVPSATVRDDREWVRLRVRVALDAERGASRPVIFVRGEPAIRAAVIVLQVGEGREFGISGDLGPLLYPGRSEPLELRLSNPNDFAIEVIDLRIRIRPSTSVQSCGAANYFVSQYSGPYPLRLLPGNTTLGELGSDPSLWPRVGMRDLPINQDACKNARITLDYRGTAVR
jgi:hypothetical protein